MKGKLYMLAAGLAAGLGEAYTEAGNVSSTAFQNFTKADTIQETITTINAWTGGVFGIMILLAFFFISLSMGGFFTGQFSRSLLASSFMVTILAAFMRIAGLIPDLAFYGAFGVLIVSLILAAKGG